MYSAYASGLWSPTRRSACGHVETSTTLAHVVYFSCFAREGESAPAAAARALFGDELSPRAALRVLLAGPTSAERRRGFASNFRAETADLPFSLTLNHRRAFALVDLDPAILDVKFVFVSVQDVAQIVSTVGQFPGIDWVVLLVGGRPLCEALGEC